MPRFILECTEQKVEQASTIWMVLFTIFRPMFLPQNKTEEFVTHPDDWGGRAIQHWIDELAKKKEFKDANYQLIKVASILDNKYKFTGR